MPDCFLLGEPRKLSAMKTIDSVPMEQVGENAEDVQQPTATAEAVDEPQNVTAEESVEPAESVDFSDEEAMLAAEQADVALGEEAEGEEPSGDATVSYSGKSKAELVEILSEKLRNEPVQTLRSTVEAIKIAFYKAHKAEIEALRREAVEKGADPDNLN